MLTIVVMSWFKHAQPALLYLVPACIGLPLTVALIKGDLGSMFSYEDHPNNEKDEKDGKNKSDDQNDVAADNKTPKAAKAKKAKKDN